MSKLVETDATSEKEKEEMYACADKMAPLSAQQCYRKACEGVPESTCKHVQAHAIYVVFVTPFGRLQTPILTGVSPPKYLLLRACGTRW